MFKPARFTGGTKQAWYYISAQKITYSQAEAISFNTEEEAWLFLESLGPLCSESCVKTPAGNFTFSGVNDKLLRELNKKHNGNVRFIRESKQYMLNLPTNR